VAGGCCESIVLDFLDSSFPVEFVIGYYSITGLSCITIHIDCT